MSITHQTQRLTMQAIALTLDLRPMAVAIPMAVMQMQTQQQILAIMVVTAITEKPMQPPKQQQILTQPPVMAHIVLQKH